MQRLRPKCIILGGASGFAEQLASLVRRNDGVAREGGQRRRERRCVAGRAQDSRVRRFGRPHRCRDRDQQDRCRRACADACRPPYVVLLHKRVVSFFSGRNATSYFIINGILRMGFPHLIGMCVGFMMYFDYT